jgi:hypothetical protein
VLKKGKTTFKPRILFPAKLYFKNEGKIETFRYEPNLNLLLAYLA